MRAVTDERKAIVSAGYDRIVRSYAAWAGQVAGDPRDRMLEVFAARLPAGGRVLDLGCGAGLPSTRALAERFEVVGVDISEGQIAEARVNVPGATFLVGDITEVDLPAASFDGVTAFYSVNHVPREEHAPLFGRVLDWLRPGGSFLAALATSDDPGWSGEWLGVPMFFSGFDPAANRANLIAAGFTIDHDEIVEMREPDGAATFQWVVARRPAVR